MPANDQLLAVNTQKLALNALAFMYHKVLNQPLGDLEFKLTSKQPKDNISDVDCSLPYAFSRKYPGACH